MLQAGGVLVPVAPELSHPERDALVRTTGLDAVLCAGGRDWHTAAPHTAPLDLPGLPATLHTGLRTTAPDFPEDALAALNPALIRFSSGTTGKRKGVVLSHQTLLDRVTASNSRLHIGHGDRVIWMLPMAHHFAVSIILYLLHGATTVLEDSHLGADVFRTLDRHAGTVLYAAPFHYALLAACPEARPVSSLRLAVSTAAALPEPVAVQFREKFGLPLSQALGIIECGLPLLNDPADPAPWDSVGRPQDGYMAEIRDPAGAPVPVGETGDLFLQGPGFVDAILSPWTPRAQLLEHGWFRTGDQASADATGAIRLAGRSQSVINVGGMKAFPEEIETVLNDHPAVAESRVTALPHPTFGHIPAAEIIPADPAAPPRTIDLIAHCRARLSGYKVPLKFTTVSTLPKTPSGKLLRT